MKRASLFILAILTIATTLSCKKMIITDKDEVDTSNFVGKKWFTTGQTMNGEDVYEDTYYACDKDDYIIFNKDGSLTESLGTLKCDASEDPDVIVYGKSWRVVGNKIYFLLDLPDDQEMENTIKVQTATKLVLVWGDENGDNITTTYSTK
ncbi:MAG: hypothetical protein EOO20_27660 [Chryseobacterium sp.]|nr:MAG: hypothetical protein EOO20_27660 [Chryseobacterium sp.]